MLWNKDKDTFFLHIFRTESENGIHYQSKSQDLSQIWKNHIFKKLLSSSKIMHVESISFNWHLFRNTNLTYDEMWKKMYLASEIIFEFILAYFILLFGHFWPKHLFDFKKNYFYVYINDAASKSLKQARKIVFLSHLKGLTKLDFAWL